jgi:hypothetical protein
VFQNDSVQTGALGRAGLQFLDETESEVGPTSSAKLDRFVFNPDKTTAEASINLAKGVFRFVSGDRARPNTYTITTPHVTLGIRGTEIVIDVTPFQTNVIFTVSGFVRAFAFQKTDAQGGIRAGAVGGAGGSGGGGGLPLAPTRGPSDDVGTIVMGFSATWGSQ